MMNRIDAMPKLSPADKANLYTSLDRARGIGKVITIPFASAKTTLSAHEIDQVKSASQAPQLAKLLNEPAVVFVIRSRGWRASTGIAREHELSPNPTATAFAPCRRRIRSACRSRR